MYCKNLPFFHILYFFREHYRLPKKIILYIATGASSPFCSYIASHFTFPSTPITHACPTLPFDGLQSAFGGVFDSNSVLFALSSSDLFKWTAGSCLAVSS